MNKIFISGKSNERFDAAQIEEVHKALYEELGIDASENRVYDEDDPIFHCDMSDWFKWWLNMKGIPLEDLERRKVRELDRGGDVLYIIEAKDDPTAFLHYMSRYAEHGCPGLEYREYPATDLLKSHDDVEFVPETSDELSYNLRVGSVWDGFHQSEVDVVFATCVEDVDDYYRFIKTKRAREESCVSSGSDSEKRQMPR